MKDIKKQIEQALASIENIEKISAPDFFETRLLARMQNELVVEKSKFIQIKKPVWIIASLCVLLFMNIYLMDSNKTKVVSKNRHDEPATIQSFANDYELDENTSNY